MPKKKSVYIEKPGPKKKGKTDDRPSLQREEWGYYPFDVQGFDKPTNTNRRLPPLPFNYKPRNQKLTPSEWLQEIVLDTSYMSRVEEDIKTEYKGVLNFKSRPGDLTELERECYQKSLKWYSPLMWCDLLSLDLISPHRDEWLTNNKRLEFFTLFIYSLHVELENRADDYWATKLKKKGKKAKENYVATDGDREVLFGMMKEVTVSIELFRDTFFSHGGVIATEAIQHGIDLNKDKNKLSKWNLSFDSDRDDNGFTSNFMETHILRNEEDEVTRMKAKGAALDIVKVAQVAILKTARVKHMNKRKTMGIVRPYHVQETTIWDNATKLADIVFNNTGVYAPHRKVGPVWWDTFTHKSIEKAFKNKRDRMDWVGAALCLIELCIGSRSRGVTLVNEFDPVFSPQFEREHDIPKRFIKTEDEDAGPRVGDEPDEAWGQLFRDFKTNDTELVTVRRLSKDKKHEAKVFKKIKQQADYNDSGATYEDRLRAAERAVDIDDMARQITKPFLYFWFDPLSYAFGIPDKEPRLARWKDGAGTPRDIFFRLVKVVREVIKKETAGWLVGVTREDFWKENKRHSGLDDMYTHWAISPEYEHSTVADSVHRECYNRMTAALKKTFGGKTGYFGTIERQGAKPATHEMRRLYVCYAYLLFGENMKEVAFAQRVLGHASIESSVFYTSIQVKQTVGGPVSEKGAKSFGLTNEIINQLKKMMNEHMRAPPSQIEESDSEEEKEEKEEKKHHFVSWKHPITHERIHVQRFESFVGKGRSDEDRIKRGVKKWKEVKALGLKPSRSKMKALGEAAQKILIAIEVAAGNEESS